MSSKIFHANYIVVSRGECSVLWQIYASTDICLGDRLTDNRVQGAQRAMENAE